jgi:D-alanyl-lipoteichoic acid acyltransferase DltB (MBOAT superfamily)
MFPPLIAGPIVRYAVIADRVDSRIVTPALWARGIESFTIGLGQKVLLANTLAGPVDRLFALAPGALSMAAAWLAAFGYALQIYFDFAGYSNMAIGLGLALGFGFPRNFRLPYTAQSMTDFWRRWHMSLSQWLRDYLYIPLGGSRGSLAETYRNLCLVFVLCGLWHGAKWTCVIWGVHHGLFLIAERAGLARVLAAAPALVARLYMLLAVMAGWVWFRADDLAQASAFFASLAGLKGWGGLSISTHIVLHPLTMIALLMGALLATVRFDITGATRLLPGAAHLVYGLADTGVIALFFALSVLSVAAGAYSPFLYFRF